MHITLCTSLDQILCELDPLPYALPLKCASYVLHLLKYEGRKSFFTIVVQALADECEYLRETALKAGQRIIDLFANEAVELLLPELEKGLLSVEWRIRLSSLHLTGDLLYKLSGVSGKGTTKVLRPPILLARCLSLR